MSRNRSWRKDRRPRGFSRRPWKAGFDMMTNGLGASGKEKRAFFNDVSASAALIMGGAAGFFSAMLFADPFGTAGGIAVGALSGVGVYALVADLLEKGRYYRP